MRSCLRCVLITAMAHDTLHCYAGCDRSTSRRRSSSDAYRDWSRSAISGRRSTRYVTSFYTRISRFTSTLGGILGPRLRYPSLTLILVCRKRTTSTGNRSASSTSSSPAWRVSDTPTKRNVSYTILRYAGRLPFTPTGDAVPDVLRSLPRFHTSYNYVTRQFARPFACMCIVTAMKGTREV